MDEQVQRTRTRAETSGEAALDAWFATLERDPFTPLEEGARQIIQLVTALYAVIFGVLAFAADPVPAYLARVSVRGLGLICVLGYLVALLAALAVVIPRPQRYSPVRPDQQRAIFERLTQRKYRGLQIAVWSFGVASTLFALLFLAVLFGM